MSGALMVAHTQGTGPSVPKTGVFAGHELLFGRLAFVAHPGFYGYDPHKFNTAYYERLGLNYHFTARLFGAIDVNVHRAVADVMEFSRGEALKRFVGPGCWLGRGFGRAGKKSAGRN